MLSVCDFLSYWMSKRKDGDLAGKGGGGEKRERKEGGREGVSLSGVAICLFSLSLFSYDRYLGGI